MEFFQSLIVGTVTEYSGTDTPDKNGEYPVMIQCMAGRMPNRNVIAGTVAKRQGLEVGHTYIIQVRKQGKDLVFGDQFTWLRVMEIKDPVALLNACEKLGPPEIMIIDRPAGFDDVYKREGNAIESIVTDRIKRGLFEPAIPRTSTNHKTAANVIPGTTIRGASEQQLNLTPEDLEKAAKKLAKLQGKDKGAEE
jgi:hypothetical protein